MASRRQIRSASRSNVRHFEIAKLSKAAPPVTSSAVEATISPRSLESRRAGDLDLALFMRLRRIYSWFRRRAMSSMNFSTALGYGPRSFRRGPKKPGVDGG